MSEHVIPEPQTDAALFEMRGVGKSFGSVPALSDVDLRFSAGEIHCLLGENGAGKSTLCNLIFGVYAPTQGRMLMAGQPHDPTAPRDALAAGIAMVHQHFSLVETLTVIDNLLLGGPLGHLDRAATSRQVRDLGATYGLRVDPDATVSALSVGERQRVEIVKCLMRDPKLLILDEPTAVLLPDEIAALLTTCRRVADGGCAVVLVTHKLAEITQAADRVSVLRAGRVVAGSDAPARDIDTLVQAMIKKDSTLETADLTLAAPPLGAARRREEALQIDGMSYKDPFGTTRLDRVTLTVNRGEVVGLAGVEGNGQSELGNILAGLIRATAGRWFAGNVDMTRAAPAAITAAGVGIIPEDRHRVAAASDMSVGETMFNNRLDEFSRWGLLDRKAMNRRASAMIEDFDIRTTGPQARFGSLSGGNQQKVILARELDLPNLRLVIAAQPTRGLDVGAVAAVYRLIRAACDAGAGVLLISSELDDILNVADRVSVIYRGSIMNAAPARTNQRDAIGAMMAGQAA